MAPSPLLSSLFPPLSSRLSLLLTPLSSFFSRLCSPQSPRPSFLSVRRPLKNNYYVVPVATRPAALTYSFFLNEIANIRIAVISNMMLNATGH